MVRREGLCGRWHLNRDLSEMKGACAGAPVQMVVMPWDWAMPREWVQVQQNLLAGKKAREPGEVNVTGSKGREVSSSRRAGIMRCQETESRAETSLLALVMPNALSRNWKVSVEWKPGEPVEQIQGRMGVKERREGKGSQNVGYRMDTITLWYLMTTDKLASMWPIAIGWEKR